MSVFDPDLRPRSPDLLLSHFATACHGGRPRFEMAVRLGKVFGGSAESWLIQQAQYDLAQVDVGHMKLKRLKLV